MAIDILAGNGSVTELAERHQVSRKFLYQQADKGEQALTVFVKKTDLSKDRHRPNGRKVYLHHPQASLVPDVNGKYPWETKDDSPRMAEQKLRCTPLQDKQDFFFHIDFDNLTKAELTLLLTSLRHSDSFCHRLGLGKSLGLGTVHVDIEGVFFICRHKRYGREALYTRFILPFAYQLRPIDDYKGTLHYGPAEIADRIWRARYLTEETEDVLFRRTDWFTLKSGTEDWRWEGNTLFHNGTAISVCMAPPLLILFGYSVHTNQIQWGQTACDML